MKVGGSFGDPEKVFVVTTAKDPRVLEFRVPSLEKPEARDWAAAFDRWYPGQAPFEAREVPQEEREEAMRVWKSYFGLE